MHPRLTLVNHPLVLEQLALARDRTTNQVAFRKAINRIGRYMSYEFARTLAPEKYEVETPLARTAGYRINGGKKIVIVMVLRASIPFVEGMYKMLPMARTGVVSAWRGKAPSFPITVDYVKMPIIGTDDTVIVADPMLATGHTLAEVTRRILDGMKPKRLVFFSVLSTRKGIAHVARSFPKAEFYTCAIDPKLDGHGYIVPGLGDAGDRTFGSPKQV